MDGLNELCLDASIFMLKDINIIMVNVKCKSTTLPMSMTVRLYSLASCGVLDYIYGIFTCRK